MSEIYLCSDIHFGHWNILNFMNRPFSSIEEMDEQMISNWNSVVSKKDRVYYLGDFSFHRDIETNRKIFNALSGEKYLIVGNHDPKPIQHLGWGWVKQNYGLKYGKEYIWLSHYPHMSWNRSYHGSRHFFGHVHDKETFWSSKNSCDVGVDYWNYSPVHIDTVIKHLDNINSQTDNNPFLWRGSKDSDKFNFLKLHN